MVKENLKSSVKIVKNTANDTFMFFIYLLKNFYEFIGIIFIFFILYLIVYFFIKNEAITWLNGVTISIIAAIVFEKHKDYKRNISVQPVLNAFYENFFVAIGTFILRFGYSRNTIMFAVDSGVGQKILDAKFSECSIENVNEKIDILIKLFEVASKVLSSSEKIKNDVSHGKANEEYEHAVTAYDEFIEYYYSDVYPILQEDLAILLVFSDKRDLLTLFYKLKKKTEDIKNYNLSDGFKHGQPFIEYWQIQSILNLTREILSNKNFELLEKSKS